MTKAIETPKRVDESKYPWARDAEKILAGCALRGDESLDSIRTLVATGHFADGWYREIFKTCCALADKKIPANISTVFLEMKHTGALKYYDKDAVHIVEVWESCPTSAASTYYASQVLDAARRRKLISIAETLIDDSLRRGDPATDIAADAEREIAAAAIDPSQFDPVLLCEDGLNEGIDDLLRRADRMRPRVWSGLLKMDDLTGGFDPGNFIVIGARPGVGKTALALRIALHVGMAGHSTYFASLEMTRSELSQRAAFMTSGVNGFSFRAGKRSQEDVHRFGAVAKEQLAGTKLWIDDTPSLKVEQIASAARSVKRRHGLKFIVVDYLQLVSPSQHGDRREQVEHISRSLKKLARELSVPVVALAQLNREVENRVDGRPKLSDLREAGGIEQDADIVALLWRLPDKEQPASNELTKIGCHIAKQRNGPTGEFELIYRRCSMRFDDGEEERDIEEGMRDEG